MTSVQRRRRKFGSNRERAGEHALRTLIAACGSPAAALEACYWSREPGLIEIIRAVAAMPEETRGAIEAFVVMARDAASVTATLDARGMLTLASAEAAKMTALVQVAAAEDATGTPRLLN